MYVNSAKYPLATINKLLDVFRHNQAIGSDIANGNMCDLPPTPMPHDLISIERQKEIIEQHMPIYTCTFCLDISTDRSPVELQGDIPGCPLCHCGCHTANRAHPPA